MRGIGAPRAVSAGLRGCALLAPNFLTRISYSGASSGRGIGSGRGRGAAPFPEDAQQPELGSFAQSPGPGFGAPGRGKPISQEPDSREELGQGRFSRWGDAAAAQTQSGSGRGRVMAEDDDRFSRWGDAAAAQTQSGSGRGRVIAEDDDRFSRWGDAAAAQTQSGGGRGRVIAEDDDRFSGLEDPAQTERSGWRGRVIAEEEVLGSGEESGQVGVSRWGDSATQMQGREVGAGRGRGGIGGEFEERGVISGEELGQRWGGAVPMPRRGSGPGPGQPSAGRGRVIGAPPLQESQREQLGRERGWPTLPQHDAGRGRVLPSSPLPPPPSPSSQGQIFGRVNAGVPSTDGENSWQTSKSAEVGTQQADNAGSPPRSSQSGQTAVERLLSKLTKPGPEVPVSRQSPAPRIPPEREVASISPPSAPVEKPTLPFRMPFTRPTPNPEQEQPRRQQQQEQQLSAPQPSFRPHVPLPLGAMGRGRGQVDAASKPAIGSEPEGMESRPRAGDQGPGRPMQEPYPPRRGQDSLGSRMPQTMEEGRGFDRSPERQQQQAYPPRRFDRSPGRPPQDGPRPPSPPRMQLSAEEARARAMAILEKGIETNLAAEGERRRIAGMDKFADSSDFFTDRFNRAPGDSPASQASRPRAARPSSVARRRDRPRRQMAGEDSSQTATAPQLQLTPEQEAQIVRIQEEDTFKERLHNLFLVHFEPEFAMEEFGINPDVDEQPVLSLEEYMESLKPMVLSETAELSAQQKWEEAVKTSLANASNLEKLVETYAGPGRFTARQQIEKLETIAGKLPSHVAPEVAAFTQRALNTLQNNPGLKLRHKEALMSKIVTGFS